MRLLAQKMIIEISDCSAWCFEASLLSAGRGLGATPRKVLLTAHLPTQMTMRRGSALQARRVRSFQIPLEAVRARAPQTQKARRIAAPQTQRRARAQAHQNQKRQNAAPHPMRQKQVIAVRPLQIIQTAQTAPWIPPKLLA